MLLLRIYFQCCGRTRFPGRLSQQCPIPRSLVLKAEGSVPEAHRLYPRGRPGQSELESYIIFIEKLI